MFKLSKKIRRVENACGASPAYMRRSLTDYVNY